jgi:hypothetical protein
MNIQNAEDNKIKYIIYSIFSIIGLIVLPGLTLFILFIWFLIHQVNSANKRRHAAEQILNEAAANNPEFSKICGIRPDYIKALGVKGIASIYLNVTSNNANKVLKENWESIQHMREYNKKHIDPNQILSTDDFNTVKRKIKMQQKKDNKKNLASSTLKNT